MDPGSRRPQPVDGDERSTTLGWLGYYRDTMAVKCHGLTPAQLAHRAAAPSHLSLLGLVRHLAEMEHAYGSWPLTVDTPLEWVWGDYADGAENDIDCGPDDTDTSFATWHRQCAATDAVVAAQPDLDAAAPANGMSVRWNLAKLVGEYARHCGHADLIRERIDGATGE
jgi:hypothetical protein